MPPPPSRSISSRLTPNVHGCKTAGEYCPLATSQSLHLKSTCSSGRTDKARWYYAKLNQVTYDDNTQRSISKGNIQLLLCESCVSYSSFKINAYKYRFTLTHPD